MFEAWIDLTAVAPGSAPTGLLGLEQHDAGTLLGEMQGGRQTGDAPAHDGHIGSHIPVERRRRGGGFRGILIQADHAK
jgi:hypothetical protein